MSDSDGTGIVSDTAVKKKHFRFSPEVDMDLLRQTVAANPYYSEHGDTMECWQSVAGPLNLKYGINISGRACRDRVKKLHEEWSKKNKESLKATGVDENYDEKWQLLTEIDELIGTAKEKKSAKTAKLNDDAILAKAMRDQALGIENAKEKGNSDKKSKKKQRNDDSTLATLLAERNKIRLQELEVRRLEAENQSKILARQQAALEASERTNRDTQRVLLQMLQQSTSGIKLPHENSQ